MRLTALQREIILRLARQSFGSDVRVYLFGSRANDEARGGDVDIYVETSLDGDAAFRARLGFEVALINHLGDRRIDVVVTPGDRGPTAFERLARQTGVAL